MNNLPEPTSKTRLADGTYATRDDRDGITEVLIPRAWKIGYQVGGPGGRIYAKREDAVKHAAGRMNYLGR